jgi:hypothetical protein
MKTNGTGVGVKRRNPQNRARFASVALALCWCMLLMAGTAGAQDAGKILREAVKASGGGAALSRVRTLILEGSVAEKDGAAAGSFTFDLKLPNRYYMEIVAGERSVIEAFNGKSAWRQNAAGEIGTLVGPEGLQLEAAARYYNSHLVGLKRNKLALSTVGAARVRGKSAFELEVAATSGAKRQVYFDAQTHLVAEEEALTGGVDEKIFYDDYRAVNGVQLPNKIEIDRGGTMYVIQITRAAVNEMVGERVFDFPRKAQVVLPDLKALFAEIRTNQKANEKLRQKYAGTKIESESELDGKDETKKTDVKESTFFYLYGEEVENLQKQDGKPLPPEERTKEDARVAAQVAVLKKSGPPKETADKSKNNSNGGDHASASDDEDNVSIDTFLRVAQFVNPRRERFHGQDVLVFDFEPNPEYKAHGLIEKIVQKLGGVIWIDEKTHEVVRLDAFFESDMKFAGGLLADLQKGTRIIFENTYFNNEVWLPTYEEVRIDLRLLMVKGFRIDESTKYFDYKKFDPASVGVETKAGGKGSGS